MRHAAHFLIGILAFAGYSYIISGISSAFGMAPAGLWLIGIILAAAGAALPDIIEPARGWSHRGFFHSRKMLWVSGWMLVITAVIGLFFPLFYYIASFLAGYVSHLLADSTTKAGLPR